MKKILVCGNSIPLAGLAASLRGVEGLEVIQSQDLSGLEDPKGLADLVLVDAADALALLRAQPAVPLLSVDYASGTVTVLSAESHPVSAVQEIVELIQGLSADSRAPRE